MKNVKTILTCVTLSVLALTTTATFALPITGLEKAPPAAEFTPTTVTNHNIEVFLNLPAKNVEQMIAPYLPAGQSMASIAKGVAPLLPAGLGRKQVQVVEPVFNQDTPDTNASGKALVATLASAASKGYPVLVYVDAGTYEINETGLNIPQSVTLVGAGEESTLIKANAVTSSSPAISQLTLKATNLTVSENTTIQNAVVQGAVVLNGGTATLTDVTVNAPSASAITINGVAGYTLKNVRATSSTTALAINNTTKGVVMDSFLHANTPIDVSENAPVTLVNNVYQGGAPRFYGDYKSSLQKCRNNVDVDTGLPVPNYASGVSQLCVAPPESGVS